MAPNLRFSKQAEENQELTKLQTDLIKDNINGYDEYKLEIVWRNVILMAALHLSALYGMYLMFFSAMWQTNLFGNLNFF